MSERSSPVTHPAARTVLAIADWYLPGTKAGGPVRSLSALVEALASEVTFLLVVSDHDLGDPRRYVDVDMAGWNKVGQAKVRYVRRDVLLPLQLARIARSVEVDAVYLNSIFSPLVRGYLLLRRMNLVRKRPIILAPRGELGAQAIAIKGMRKRIYLRITRLLGLYERVTWVASTPFERDDIRAIFSSNRSADDELDIHVVPNIARAPTTYGSPTVAKEVGRLRTVFLSRIDRKKNLDGALRMLQRVTQRVTFDVYGPCGDARYLSECESIAAGVPPNVQVRFLGEVPAADVPEILREYDLFFLPTLNENFGHVIIEALSAGCPVLISDQTAWRGLEKEGAGWDVDVRDGERFVQILDRVAEMSADEIEPWRLGARRFAERELAAQRAVEANRALFLRCEPSSQVSSDG